MTVAYDREKDAANIAKHGVSLARAADIDLLAVIEDRRFAGERRYRGYGLIDGRAYCLAFVVRDGVVRAISLRRAHAREMKRHASQGPATPY